MTKPKSNSSKKTKSQRRQRAKEDNEHNNKRKCNDKPKRKDKQEWNKYESAIVTMTLTDVPLGSLIDRLKRIEPTRFNLHEKYIYQIIGLSGDACMMREKLTKIITAIKSGSFIDESETRITIDVSAISFFFENHGSKENFGGKYYAPRWLCFRNHIPIKEQISFMKNVTGTCRKLIKSEPTIATERNSMWLKWYHRDRDVSRSYEEKHLPQIMTDYPDIIVNSNNSAKVRSQIFEMLKCSNCIPNEVNIRGNNDRADINDSPNQDLTQLGSKLLSSKTLSKIENNMISDQTQQEKKQPYAKENLQCLDEKGKIDSNKLLNLAQLEYNIAINYTNDSFHERAKLIASPGKPSNVEETFFQELNNYSLNQASTQIKEKREEIFKNNIRFFVPSSSELLIEWLRQEELFTNNNERITTNNNFEKHESNSIQFMTNKASSYIRHIIFALEKKTENGTPSLIAWAKRIEKYSTSTPSRIASHLALLLLKPEIILALHFESEMGSYFEVTMNWHSQPGETNTRNNFRMLEIHTFWFEFVIP